MFFAVIKWNTKKPELNWWKSKWQNVLKKLALSALTKHLVNSANKLVLTVTPASKAQVCPLVCISVYHSVCQLRFLFFFSTSTRFSFTITQRCPSDIREQASYRCANREVYIDRLKKSSRLIQHIKINTKFYVYYFCVKIDRKIYCISEERLREFICHVQFIRSKNS